MSRVRPEGIDQFHERLEEFKRSNKASLSIKDVVAKSRRKIEEARNYGATWDDVAKLLSESFQTDEQGGLQVTGKTIQGYYSKILKEREKKLSPKTTNASTPSEKRTKKAAIISEESLNPIPLKTTELDNDSRASMNGSESGLIQSPKEDEPSPLVEEALRKKGSFDHWQEPVFNVNRVRPVDTEI